MKNGEVCCLLRDGLGRRLDTWYREVHWFWCWWKASDDGLEVSVTEGSPQPSDGAVDDQHQQLDPIQSSSSGPSLESDTDTASEEVQALEPSPEQDESPECSSESIEDLVIDHEELLPSSDNVELPDETETGDEQKNSAPVLRHSRRRRKSPDSFGTTV